MKFPSFLKLGLGVAVIILCTLYMNAQPSQADIMLQSWLETNQNDEIDFALQLENLEQLKDHPIDLNAAGEDDLKLLFFLTENQIKDILIHKSLYGRYLCLEELQSIASLKTEEIQMMLPYVWIPSANASKAILTQIFSGGKHTLYVKTKRILENIKGFSIDSAHLDNRFLGFRHYLSVRYKYETGKHFKIGFNGENDAGEKFAWNQKTKGIDFFTAYLQWKKLKYIENLILGDYSVSMGQGLLIHNGFGAGKSTMVMNIKKTGETFRPYTSINESLYFRGMAGSIHLSSNWTLHSFYSSKKTDGIIAQNPNDIDLFEITSFQSTGYHRSDAEIKNKGTVRQQNWGGSLGYRRKNFNCHINHLAHQFNYPVSRGDQTYETFQLNGTMTSNTSMDYGYRFKNLNVFGEIAVNNKGSMAQLHGLLLALDKKLDFSLSIRKYGKSYTCLSCNAFGESSVAQAESGIFWGLEFRPHHQWKLSGYFDSFNQLWLKYKVDGLASGTEFSIRIEHSIKRKLLVYLQLFSETKEGNELASIHRIKKLEPIVRNKIRLHLNHQFSRNLEFRARAEMVYFSQHQQNEKGYALYSDILYHPMSSPLTVSARYMLFETEGFNSRIYSYENDLLYEFALPFVSGSGQRFYTNLRYKFNERLTGEFRYSITKYNDQQIISESSVNEIEGNQKSEIKLQLKFMW